MRTALDMAKRLNQPSLRKIAEEVAVLNHVPIPKPPTLLQIMKLFAKIAAPEPPSHVANELLFPDTSPTLSPIHSLVTWNDPGAKTFRFATYYRCRISVLYDGGSAQLNSSDNWTRDRFMGFQNELNFDTGYKVAIMAYNDWGASEWSWLKFTTYSNPNPKSGPGPSQPAPTTPHPSGFLFWNCDVTGVGEHLDVYFWLFDLSTGQSWNWFVPADYDASGTCPSGSAQIVIPSTSTITLVEGHNYTWIVVKPDNEGCGGNNDPHNSACTVAGSNFTAGGDPAIAYTWTNT
jgi:hypothetical protein